MENDLNPVFEFEEVFVLADTKSFTLTLKVIIVIGSIISLWPLLSVRPLVVRSVCHNFLKRASVSVTLVHDRIYSSYGSFFKSLFCLQDKDIGKDELLGCTEIDFSSVLGGSSIRDQWIDLDKAKKGRVQVSVKFSEAQVGDKYMYIVTTLMTTFRSWLTDLDYCILEGWCRELMMQGILNEKNYWCII